METIRSFFKPKKVELSDIASPKPSKAATRVLNGALKRAHDEQQEVLRKAGLRNNSATSRS